MKHSNKHHNDMNLVHFVWTKYFDCFITIMPSFVYFVNVGEKETDP